MLSWVRPCTLLLEFEALVQYPRSRHPLVFQRIFSYDSSYFCFSLCVFLFVCFFIVSVFDCLLCQEGVFRAVGGIQGGHLNSFCLKSVVRSTSSRRRLVLHREGEKANHVVRRKEHPSKLDQARFWVFRVQVGENPGFSTILLCILR